MRPLYTENKMGIKISRGPLDKVMLALFLFIMTIFIEFCLFITMLSSDNRLIFIVLMIVVLTIFVVMYLRKEKEYENTSISINEDKIVIKKHKKDVEIRLDNLEKVTLDGSYKGITVNDLVMTFVLKEGNPVKSSCLGDNTYLFLNMLSKRGVSVFELNQKYSPRLVLLDLLSENDIDSLISDSNEFFNDRQNCEDMRITYNLLPTRFNSSTANACFKNIIKCKPLRLKPKTHIKADFRYFLCFFSCFFNAQKLSRITAHGVRLIL